MNIQPQPLQEMTRTDPHNIEEEMSLFKGEFAFDIGANCGQSVQKLLAGFRTILAVEPNWRSFKVLRERYRDSDRVFPMHAAVSSELGTISLDVREDSDRTGQLTTGDAGQHPWGERTGTQQVWSVPLDYLMEVHGVPDFVKIDVEAHEVKVLVGAKDLMKIHRPVMFIEIHSQQCGWGCEVLLREAGYERIKAIHHPRFSPGDWGYLNHFWMIAQ